MLISTQDENIKFDLAARGDVNVCLKHDISGSTRRQKVLKTPKCSIDEGPNRNSISFEANE